jgi:hypothetical protein
MHVQSNGKRSLEHARFNSLLLRMDTSRNVGSSSVQIPTADMSKSLLIRTRESRIILLAW